MSKVYELKQDTENYANFIEQRDNFEDAFHYKYWGLKNIDLKEFNPIKLKLYASDTGKKNYQTDISYISSGLFVFSENALKVFKDIFEEKLDDNLLISLKGDSDYLEKHNLQTSGRYLRQQEQIKILTGKQFVNINCGVCNDCNGK